MVDIRPLLFINFLMILLLITAGFKSVQVIEQAIDDEVPAPWVSTPQTNTTESPQLSKNVIEPETSEYTKDTSETSEALAALKMSEDAAFSEEAIFADEISAPKLEASPFRPSKSEDFEIIVVEEAKAPKIEEPTVVSYINTPPPPAKESITTGTLVVRSNVSEDIVLINGKPYGPTKLELKLTPGNYKVEVAKDGYQGWSTNIDIRRGSTRTLSAQLEHYTKVEHINGVWQNDIKTGEGHYLEEGKLEYNGSFVNSKFHGSGSIRYSNGMKYNGEWFQGSMQGQGSLTTTDGDTYIGELDDNKFNGEGTLTKATGDIYSGFWIDGVLNGQGSLTTQGGLLYVGGFSDNLFHGNGSLTYPDGGHYEGSFSNGMFHGKGVETYANGKKYVGQFIDGLYHGKGEILNPNGSKITGTFKDGKAFGKATLTTAEGEIFTARSSEPGVCYRQKSYRATECPQLDGW